MTGDPILSRYRYRDRLPKVMDEKMAAGAERYGEDAWLAPPPEYFWRRMEEELMEFRQAVEHDRDPDAALRELADIANFGTMYAALHFPDAGGSL